MTYIQASISHECKAEPDRNFNLNRFKHDLCGDNYFKQQVFNQLKESGKRSSSLWNLWRENWHCDPKFIEIHHSHLDSRQPVQNLIQDINCRANFHVS